MLLSRHQSAGQNQDIKIANRCFENVAQFRYLGTTTTNQNLVKDKIKNRLNSGSVCYHTVQKLLSSPLLPKNVQIRIYKTMRMKWTGHVFVALVGKPGGKRPLE
jgi:hypothetical protein